MRLELMTSSLPRMCATTCATSAYQKGIYILDCKRFGGATQNRTGGKGVADLCLTAWLWRRVTAHRGKFGWSGLRGSNPLPPPWQGGALPNELNPHICALLNGKLCTEEDELAIRMGLEPTTSAVTGRHSNQLNYRTVLACVSALDYNIISFSKMQYLFEKNFNFFLFLYSCALFFNFVPFYASPKPFSAIILSSISQASATNLAQGRTA